MGRVIAGLAALIAFSMTSPVIAAPLLYTFSGGRNGTFQLDSNPVPITGAANLFTQLGVSNGTGDFSGASSALFLHSGNADTLQVFANTSVLFQGPQLYSGPENAPTMLTGKFGLTVCCTSDVTLNVTTVASPGAPAPELATGWLAALATATALALTRVRRRNAQAA